MLIQVEIASFALDLGRNSPLIVLKELNGNRALPVPVGPLEASVIAIESLKVKPEKPLTIDLLKLVIDQFGGVLTRVIFHDFVENSFAVKIQIADGATARFVECRPCDAIALALRCHAPIYVKETVFEKSVPGESLTEQEKLRRGISSLDTLEFGRYVLE